MKSQLLSPGKHARSTLVALIILILSTIVPGPSAVRAEELSYHLPGVMPSSIGTNLRGLDADGALMVWQESRDGIPDVMAYDLDDQRQFRLTATAGHRTQPAVSGPLIVWVAGSEPGERRIEGIDLSQRRAIQVTGNPGEVSDPAISGDVVVWRHRVNHQWDLWAKRLSSGETFQITNDSANQAYPTVSGTTVVWQDYRNGNWDIYRHDLSTGQVDQLTSTPHDETNPVISENDLVFTRELENGGPPEIVLVDLMSRTERVVVSGHTVMQPDVANGVMVWQDWRSGLPDIYAYDIKHDHMFAVARSQQTDDPAVSDRVIAWVSRSGPSQGRVQAREFTLRLPTDPQPPPAVPSPDHLYVQETQHFMSAGFKRFWQAHGGPRLLGYPLTEEIPEEDPETGEEIIVQYFERVKLEYRPSAPEDERVTLARLGVELTEHRESGRIQPIENSEDRIYFPETGHSLAHGFKEFWENNGGLAMFGFPISEEITENGRTVQYFERARFEFNPDAEGDYRVTLGLLGREALQRKGWLPRPPIDTTMLAE